MTSAPPPERCYGIDIETNTSVDGLDPRNSDVVAVAVSTSHGDFVMQGAEPSIIERVDQLLSSLAPGVLITWNGTRFDLPFLAVRADRLGIGIGLVLGGNSECRWPPPSGSSGVPSSWWSHRHLDGYRLYRDDVGRCLRVSCALKPLSRLVGLKPVEVDRSRIHELSEREIRDYVASDARLARELVLRRMPAAFASVDRLPSLDGPGDGLRGRGDRALVPGPSPSPSL